MLSVKEAFEKHGNYLFGAALIFIFLAVGFFWALSEPAPQILIEGCGDGTPYEQCSEDNLYFCSQGTLIEDPETCDCPELTEFNLTQENNCKTQHHIFPKENYYTYFLEGEEKSLEFEVFLGINSYVSNLKRSIESPNGENVSRLDFKLKSLNDSLQNHEIKNLVKEIQNTAQKSKLDQARIAISLVQNIPYSALNESINLFGEELNFSRYPYEVLYDREGICGEKSQLLAFILKELGYKTSIFYFQEENHEAVGIGCPIEESFNGTGFCFVETSGPAILSDSEIIYIGGIELDSNPEILEISEGISLPPGLEEYGDAEDIKDIRERNLFGMLKFWKKDDLERKYNLAEEYNLR